MTQMQAPELNNFSLANGDSLLVALFIAAAVHALILLGINFSAPEPPKVSKSIEITLSHAPVKKAPKEAKYLAPDHQIGAGDDTRKPEPLKENLPSPGQEAAPAKKVVEESSPAPKKPVAEKIMTQKQAKLKMPVAPIEKPEQSETPAEVVEDKPQLSAESLQQQIAQLGEKIRNSQQSSQDTKIKFVNSISTHKYMAAQYVKDWEDKVERTGNLNYPEAARKKGESQTLTLDVGINADGSIYSMRIVRSSGNPALDEAAKRIVRMSAPFAELPAELLQEVNVLVITRVWKFSDETGMTTR
ncbi:MAG: energy transducer TonB [Methylomonas sp.]